MANEIDVIREIEVLLHGLRTAIQGDLAAINRLTSSAPSSARDGPVFIVFSIFFFVLNWGIRKLLVQPYANLAFPDQISKKDRKKNIEKFSQCALEVLFYGGFSIIGCFIVPRQEWFWPSALWWKGFTDGGGDIMRADLRAYYLLYGARYFQGLISVFLEHKRKDFAEMVAHHLVTVLLILVSFAYGWNRVGAIIMLLLDPADVFLHIAKMCKYASDSILKGKPRKVAWQTLADIWFATFTLVFTGTRIIMYPYVVWSANFETHWVHGAPEYVCRLLLFILMILQFYWFYLMASAIYRMIQNGGVEDTRSDDEDDVDTKKEE